MKVIAMYNYISPEGTIKEGSGKLVETMVLQGDFSKVWDSLLDNYDGQEYLKGLKYEAQMDLRLYGSWENDDYSSGQLTKIFILESFNTISMSNIVRS
jgi:hypothetical protein